MMKSGIYYILNTENRRHYIGSAVDIHSRWLKHLSELRRGVHHSSKLQNAFNKYGESAFRFVVIERVEPAKLAEREQFFLDETLPFYNILRRARSAQGFRHSDETKRRLRQTALERWSALSTDEKHRRAVAHGDRIRGRTAPAEVRAKMSEAQKRRMGPRANNIAATKTPEALARQREALARWWCVTSPEGVETKVKNITEFCRTHELCQGHLCAVARGARAHHKGWKARRIEPQGED